MRTKIIMIINWIFIISAIYGQETISFIPREIINVPTAGSLDKGGVGVNLRVYPRGGLLSGLSAGVADPFLVTIYFGGENIIGVGEVNWNPQVGVDLRFRVVNETVELPAISGTEVRQRGADDAFADTPDVIPTEAKPADDAPSYTSRLLEAKRRARQQHSPPRDDASES